MRASPLLFSEISLRNSTEIGMILKKYSESFRENHGNILQFVVRFGKIET